MVKYQVSKFTNILQPTDYLKNSSVAAQLTEQYILSDQLEDKQYLITETVKYFIEKFDIPKTPAEVLQEVASDVHSEVEKVEPKCTAFFNFLRKRKIVVPENYQEVKETRQPLYKEGDLIGDLRVMKIIANKKNVDIYLTLNEETSITYVVKLLNEKKIADKVKYEEELLFLGHEYSMLQRANSIPSICQAFAFVHNSPEEAYLVLEHITGKPLSAYMRQSEILMPALCYILIQNILQAFAGLHDRNLIHGDIHPSNIMVNEDLSIKIIDLGFSFDFTVENDELVKYGGVYYYMPPERINISSRHKFSCEPDFYSEVYQLGLIMYLIFYRQVPFSGFTWEELASNIKNQEVPFPEVSSFNFPVPEPVIKIIQKCLHKKPNKRYATATDLLQAFKQVTPQKRMITF